MSEQIKKIGNYVLLEKIAVGGMAEVYLAKMISSDRLVAIKKILANHSGTNEYIKLFQEEVKVSLNLRHGNIVSFVDYILEKNELYLVMEFVNGMTLRQLVGDLRNQKSKLSLAQSLFIVSEVADGLDHAYRAVDAISHKKLNVIHRDMNPHNIMIGFDGGIKIIDFGIAKADSRTDQTQVGTIKGKFGYMSPEQASAQPIDHRTDIYALGVVLWELITGQRMHPGKNDLETLKKIRSAVVRSPREIDIRIPVEIERIVMRSLKRDPNERYQKIADFRADLNQLLIMKYPDFRSSDFADFIEKKYADLIKSRIEKLSYFARVKFTTNETSVKSISLESVVRAVRRSEGTENTRLELPEGFADKTVTKKMKVLNFDNLKSENNVFAAEVKTHTKQKAANFFSEPKPLSKSVDEIDLNDPNLTKIFKNPVVWNVKHLAFLLIGMYALFSAYNQFVDSRVDRVPASLVPSSEVQVVLDTSMNGHAVADFQQPLGGIKQGDFSADFFKKMKASGKLSYANISVTNSSASDTTIFVDGKLIYDRPPLRRFPVYANQTTTITAYNSRLQRYDERKIVVQPGKTANVKLVLRPYHKKK